MNPDEKIIDIKNLSFGYGREKVLENVSLRIEAGEFLGIVGPNGGGKTTLLKIILGFLRPESGSVRVLGKSPEQSVSRIGYVPQHADFDLEFPISVHEVVLMGLLGQSSRFGRFRSQDREKTRRILTKVDMHEFRHRRFGDLSGGQRQRALIARALVGDPQLLIMDEPTSNVDSWSQKQIFDLLSEINKNCTIIVVSHDLHIVPAYVTRVACLNRTLVIHPTKELTSEVLENMYHTPVQFVDHEKKVLESNHTHQTDKS
ncbi:MAG: metal ABC transporter ATP-binding protein [Candidatus Omnitrophica bacterium]|nr:metal ABC transporter ATP-binding protein [Candidatus Omnitrophota bacterium]